MLPNPRLTGCCIFIVTIAFLVALQGCKPSKHIDIHARQDNSVPLSPALDINFYLDGSGSIAHFIEAPQLGASGTASQTNYFRNLLDNSESLLRQAPKSLDPSAGNASRDAWKDVRFGAYTFGGAGAIKPMREEGGLHDISSNPSFFHEGNTFIETPLQGRAGKAPATQDDPAARPELKIIVTDLYQSNGRLERPGDALAARYLSDEKGAVGIIAVRNPFNGPVEDLPGMTPHTGLPDAARTMPFYVIVAGPAADVRHAVEVLVQGTEIRNALQGGRAQVFFFSKALRAFQQSTPVFSATKGFSKEATNYQHQGIPRIALDRGILTFRWTDPRDKQGSVVRLNTSSRLEPQAVRVSATGEMPDAAASEALDANTCTAKEVAQMCVQIDRSKLQNRSTYVVRIDRIESYAQPNALDPHAELMQQWSIEPPDAEAVVRAKAFPARLGKTPDLAKFLTALENKTYQSDIHLATYYLYLDTQS